jgi:glycosyltransferase involved in cell wall biosynthesis
MKIIFFTELYLMGGVHRFIIDLVQNWPKEDKLILICNKSMPGIEEMNRRFQSVCKVVSHDRGIIRFCEEEVRCKGIKKKIVLGFRTILQFLQIGYHAVWFKRLFNQYNPDRVMIINGGYPGGYTCRAAALTGLFETGLKKPIMNFHNLPVKSKWVFAIPEYFLDLLINKSVHCFVTVSKSANYELRRRPGLMSSVRKYIYNGTKVGSVDKNRIVIGGVREELRIPENSPIVLMLATYEARKGHEFLFKAFVDVIQEVPEARLVIAGHGSMSEIQIVERLVESYKLAGIVHLLGFRNDVVSLLGQSQVVVVPSQHSESFGLTIVEAMAQRIPVVATQVGGIPEVLENGQGGYTVPLKPGLFAEKVIALLKDSRLRVQVGDSGYKVVKERFSLDRMVEDYYKLTRGRL